MRPTTVTEAVTRAHSMLGLRLQPPGGGRPRPIAYRLKRYNGGKDPFAPHPAVWAPDTKRWSLDCSGFVAWCLGFDRYQPGSFDFYGGYISTASMILASRAEKPTWFERLAYPELGCLAVYGSTYENGVRKSVGHVGLVTGLPAEFDPQLSRWSGVRVVHCSSGAFKRTGDAIIETSATLWRRKRGLFLRYLSAR